MTTAEGSSGVSVVYFWISSPKDSAWHKVGAPLIFIEKLIEWMERVGWGFIAAVS